jgi:hypothetical protein
LHLHAGTGNKWSTIAKTLENGRTSESVKSRFKTLSNRNSNRNRDYGSAVAALVCDRPSKGSVSPAQRFKSAVVAVQAATWLHSVFALDKLLGIDLGTIEESGHSGEGFGDFAEIFGLINNHMVGSIMNAVPPPKRQKVDHTRADMDLDLHPCGSN